MKRTNGASKAEAGREGICYTQRTIAVPIQLGTQTKGGLFQESAMRCTSTIIHNSLPCGYLTAITRPARTDPAEKGRTGATPLFLPLYRQTGRGGTPHHLSRPKEL